MVFVRQARLNNGFNTTHSRVLILVSECKVARGAASFANWTTDSLVFSNWVRSNTWVVFANDELQISFCCTLIACQFCGWISDLAGIRKFVSCWSWWNRFIFVKTLGLNSKLHHFIFVDFTFSNTLRNRLPDLFSCVVSWAWHIQCVGYVDLFFAFLRFKSCRSGRPKNTIVLENVSWVAGIVLAWT